MVLYKGQGDNAFDLCFKCKGTGIRRDLLSLKKVQNVKNKKKPFFLDMQSADIFCIFKMPLAGNHNLTICFKFDSNERQQKKNI